MLDSLRVGLIASLERTDNRAKSNRKRWFGSCPSRSVLR